MSWGKVKIGECCEITSSKRIFYSEYVESGVPFYRSKEIIESSNGQAISEPLFISQEKYDEIKRNFGVPQAGDMLLTSVGTIGVPYVVKEDDYFYFKDGNLTWFRKFNGNLEPKYLYYWVRSAEGQGVLYNTTIGSSQKALTIASLKGLEIPCPPIAVQNRIVEILTGYDALIENNQKQIKLLEEAAQRLYKEWFADLRFPGHEKTKIIEGIPEGWSQGVLGDIVLESGKKISREKRAGYSYYLPVDCLPKKSLGYVATNEIALAESSLVAFSPRDIVFGAMRPYFHKVVVARDSGITRTTCFVLNAGNPAYWAYAVMLMFSSDTVDYATQISVGTTMPYTRWKDFKRMPIVIPSEECVIAFGEAIEPIISKINGLAKQIVLLQQARDRLLPKLMNGEIAV